MKRFLPCVAGLFLVFAAFVVFGDAHAQVPDDKQDYTVIMEDAETGMLLPQAGPEDPEVLGRVLSIRGNWSGKWTSNYGATGEVWLAINQEGSKLWGKSNIFGTDCGDWYGVKFTGTIRDNIVRLKASTSCDGYPIQYRFRGKLSDTRKKLRGRYTGYVDADFYDDGRFIVTKQ